jgi:hypothetical protein
MSKQPSESDDAADRRLFWRRVAIAPVCLLLVAAWHLLRVWTVHQTPWKGGGFGMFSTVDSESARFVRCYLVTDVGRLPLPIPPGLDKTVAELRAAPTLAGVQALAERLAAQPWRWRDAREGHEVQAIREYGGHDVSAAMLRQARRAPAEAAREPLRGVRHVLEPLPLDAPPSAAVPALWVDVGCWQCRFESSAARLAARHLYTATAAVPDHVRAEEPPR